MEPRRFFDTHLRPNYQEWLEALTDERLAMNAVAAAHNMAAHVLHYWASNDPSQVYKLNPRGRGAEDEYRTLLAEHESADFALVRDVAEAHKHVKLNRKPRRLTASDQVMVRDQEFCLSLSMLDVDTLGPCLVVVEDNGDERALQIIMRNVMEMWERLLRAWML